MVYVLKVVSCNYSGKGRSSFRKSSSAAKVGRDMVVEVEEEEEAAAAWVTILQWWKS